METNSKQIGNEEEFMDLIPNLSKFPALHNKLKTDFLMLLQLTDEQKNNPEAFKTLTRVCLLTLFTVIEADLFYYNIFDKYDKYKDSDGFIKKFKNTFTKICATWNREELRQEYFDNKFSELEALRSLRNKLTHPKEVEHFYEPTEADYHRIKAAFNDYDTFFSAIMSNFFFEIKIPFNKLFNL